MKTFLILFLAISSFGLNAQKDTTYYKHQVSLSFGPNLISNFMWWNMKDVVFVNFTASYFYRPMKWFWVGGNFGSYLGNKMEYHWKEYYPDGTVRKFSRSKLKYCAVMAPEIRFSYLNKRGLIMYSAVSAGICLEDGYDDKKNTYPIPHLFIQFTGFGISGNFGKEKNIFLGGEAGFGLKGILSIHGGYRF